MREENKKKSRTGRETEHGRAARERKEDEEEKIGKSPLV